MKRGLLLLLLVGCAGSFGGRPRETALEVALAGRAAAGWRAVAEGDHARAAQAFTSDADQSARFGRITLAFETGQDELATRESLDLLAAVAAGPHAPLDALLADATAARLADLFEVVLDPTALEDRLLALPRHGLPWRARLAIEDVADLIARRRGDPAILAARAGDGACLTRLTSLGTVGRLARLDLAAPAGPRTKESADRLAVLASGCRLVVAPRDGWAGVRALAAEIPPAQVPRLLVLDFDGPALVRLDPGGRHEATVSHENERSYGPRARAIVIPASDRALPLELRLGGYGGPMELRLFLVPAGPELVASAGPGSGDAALADLATLLRARIAGEVDLALAAAARLEARPRFALGLVAAAAFLAHDPTRPSTIARPHADGLFRRAVKQAPGLVRALRALGGSELGNGRGSEAAALAGEALAARPAFWPAAVTLIDAQRSRGLERQADAALDEALRRLGERKGGCPLLQMAFDQARTRHQVEREAALIQRLARCDERLTPEVDWLSGRGEPERARAALAKKQATAADPIGFLGERATLELAAGDPAAAVASLTTMARARLRDPTARVRLADARAAAGGGAAAALAETARHFPADPGVARVARLHALPLPMQDFHRDGRAVIDEYRASKQDYDAPAVLVLDRTVMRALPDGTLVVLTHNIVNVKTKDGITRWGEVAVPAGAEILALRTHKPDGSTREPEEIGGKETISAPDLAPGDFVEWETLEYRAPTDGLAPGFLGERFYFQSVELPLHLSELVLVAPEGTPIDVDARAGAPAPVAGRAKDGARTLTFTARAMPQLHAERAAVRAEEWIPSVRASSGYAPEGYLRVVQDGLYGLARGSPALRAEAERIAAGLPAGARGEARAAAVVRWVRERIEPEASLYETATATLARGRGNRAGLMVALARALGLRAEIVLARALEVAPADAPVVAQELGDFGEVLVRFVIDGQAHYIDPGDEHAAFGYLSPRLDGARVLVPGGAPALAAGRGGDRRRVQIDLRLDETGHAAGGVTETLHGWPAIEWAAFAKQTADDPQVRRQEFEQRWLGQHFPGARLGELAIDIDRARPGEVRLRYGVSGVALASNGAGRIVLPFFRISAGRRFATLPNRRTGLLLGPEIPIELAARITLPAGATVKELGAGGEVDVGLPGAAFAEQRRVRDEGGRVVLELERRARLPLTRVAPAGYEAVAAALRRMDALERAEIRYAGGASPAGPGPGKVEAP